MSDYEIEVTWNGKDYAVDANVIAYGNYLSFEATRHDPAEVVVSDEPEFHISSVYDLDTGEPLGYIDDDLVGKALEVLREIYWDRELNR